MSCQTPVLFLIFNRPEVTQRVFEQIRKQKPAHLFLAADGPRPDKAGEAEKCLVARELVLQNIDWDCQVKTLLRDSNLGCGKAVSGAINWFFDQVDEGIILEDDCLPDDSFFSYCAELLERYRDDAKVMHIGGCNFQNRNVAGRSSYYFSNYMHIWGWATWKRAWKNYTFSLPGNDREMDYLLRQKFRNKAEQGFWEYSFHSMAQKLIDTWDIQWVYSVYKANGMGVSPAKNLVSNIGFGHDATHTRSFDKRSGNLLTDKIEKVIHPVSIRINEKADRRTFNRLFRPRVNYFSLVRFEIGKRLPVVKRVYLNMRKQAASLF